MIKCEMWIAMNEDGDWVVVQEEGDALSTLADNCGGYRARVVKVTASMLPPQEVEAEVTVPGEAGKDLALPEVLAE